jgi:hypothetical protein
MTISHRQPKRNTLALAVALALTGCGGGGGSSAPGATSPAPAPAPAPSPSPASQTTTLSGVVVDGYVQGATVYLDVNNNGIQDAGEPSGVTSASGQYVLTSTSPLAQINGMRLRITGGIDQSTGQPFTHSMSTVVEDAGSKPFVIVTPLTTLIDGMLASGAAANITQARDSLARALGLSSSAVLEKDPLTLAATEPTLLQKMVALQKAMEVLASSDKAATEAGTNGAMGRVAAAVGAEIVRLATSIPAAQTGASVTLPSVADVISGATANQSKYFGNKNAVQATSALAADVANLTEATISVGVSQVLQSAPGASGATLLAALASNVDARLKVIETLQDGAVNRAAQSASSQGSSAPVRLDEVARAGNASAALQALVNVTRILTSIPAASGTPGNALNAVQQAILQLPTAAPTPAPTGAPTPAPTPAPTLAPTQAPTPAPTATPTPAPTPAPTAPPTASPTPAPTQAPTPAPTATPTPAPTPAPTLSPTPAPTPAPAATPTPAPTPAPTLAPNPTPAPSAAPTPAPTPAPTLAPTPAPTPAPTAAPTPAPTLAPTPAPTAAPTAPPTPAPTAPPDGFITR